MASTSRSPLATASDSLGKDLDKKDVDSYLTSPRRRSVVIDDDRCVEIPIQMNPQLDASKLRSVAGRPPTPIPSDEEEDEDDEKDSPTCEEGKFGLEDRDGIGCHNEELKTPEKAGAATNCTDDSLH
ncbi:uncharacterized protein LOC100908290 [Galendromus occidentalis]|uniref:Uncharacterized protein LOC100908290 n=1 Tax=Galendromus occidentalis TaxID=34638 RepID=A0AAJ7L817_9ACAR|nr:uncharacterized protein LOC100908290 [Galendromus occidentalis]XP_018496928.1 uncharacterized protein LOC100908290 [Galendromus occidentalis]